MKIAITGGIGSGKSYICNILKTHGINVYDCDERAKTLLKTSKELQEKLCNVVGDKLFNNNSLNKAMLAEFILKNKQNAQTINNIIHPIVANDFNLSKLNWIESAILFSSGFYKLIKIDKVICVSAPIELRIRRIMKRDNITKEKAKQWIMAQQPQEELIKMCNFEIKNNEEDNIEQQINNILSKIKIK